MSEQTPIIYAGLDAGRSDTALMVETAGGRVEHILFPSAIGSGDVAALLQQREASGTPGLGPEEYVLQLDGGEQFVGALAMEQSRDATTLPGDDTRYHNGHVRGLMATAVARLIERKVIPNGAVIRLFTGTPNRLWSNAIKRLIQRSLVGDYRFPWGGHDGKRKPLMVSFTIDAVGVGQEAAAVNWDFAMKPAPVAVLDVGGGTVDWHWSVQRRPVDARCHQERDMGVWKIAQLLRQKTRAAKNGRDLSDAEVRALLDAYARKADLPVLYNRGKELVLNGEIKAACVEVGTRVAGTTRELWAERDGVGASLARVKLIGGGSYFIRQQLVEVLPQVVIPARPELENVSAFLALAKAASEAGWAKSRGDDE